MHRIHPFLILGAIVAAVVIALSLFPPTVTITPSPVASSTPQTEAPIEYPPLEEMVGALFMIGHWADRPVASTTALLTTHHIGGVIIMSAPEDTTLIKSWTDTWNQSAANPLFIAIDQEGGPVSRLKDAPYATTSQRDITTADEAYTIGLARGKNLHNLGINLNFAPVLERASSTTSFLYKRTFPNNTDHVALGAALLSGMASSSVAGVVKHFPGHADTPADSHVTLPEVSITRAELDDFTSTFHTLIATKPPLALMTAHVRYPLIDDKPATLSPFFLTEYLREDIGFTGIIITDDLIMQAIATTTPSDTAAVEAIAAGADICLFAAEPEKVSAAIAAVLNAVQTGTISESRITESYLRIQNTKATLTN